VVCNDGLVAFPKPRFTSAMPAYDGSGDHSAITVEPRRTAKCTAARSSFAQAPSAENRNGTGPASRQLQDRADGVTPAGLFSCPEIARRASDAGACPIQPRH
jgi:hypothetical protein